MTHLSLFSGIGGIDLAAHWAGFTTVAFCEIDPFCQRVLARHWPGVPIYDDIRTLTAESLYERGIGRVDLLSGGFPCQDLSVAGYRKGLAGKRSGLFYELLRVACEVRPVFLLLENVSGLLSTSAFPDDPESQDAAIDVALDELDAAGYAVFPPLVFEAADMGAPFLGERVFLVAATRGDERFRGDCSFGVRTQGEGGDEAERSSHRDRPEMGPEDCGRLPGPWAPWSHQPPTKRVVDGIPNQLDRIRALGNAVCPQQVYPVLAGIAACLEESR